MKQKYVQAMDVLHRFCMVVAGFCLVAITLIIPWGVFTRYVLNSASSWPEPMAEVIKKTVYEKHAKPLMPFIERVQAVK